MIRFLMEAGPVIWPIFFLVLVIDLVILWNIGCLLLRKEDSPIRRLQSIDAVLFWGFVAAVLGFLGQWIGIHKLSVVVAELGIISPQAVAYGISESLLTPITGMAVLVYAAFVWFLLRLGLWTVEKRA